MSGVGEFSIRARADYRLELHSGWHSRNGAPSTCKEGVTHDLSLLLKTVILEPPASDDCVPVAAKRVAHQRQIVSATPLGLPDVGHLMDEQALVVDAGIGEVAAPAAVAGVEMDAPGGRHDRSLRLKRPPLVVRQPDLAIVDGIAEHRPGKLDFAVGHGSKRHRVT